MALKQNLRYWLEILFALILSYIAAIAKVIYALVYTNIFLFNLFDLLVYGSFSFLIGYFSKWKKPQFK